MVAQGLYSFLLPESLLYSNGSSPTAAPNNPGGKIATFNKELAISEKHYMIDTASMKDK